MPPGPSRLPIGCSRISPREHPTVLAIRHDARFAARYELLRGVVIGTRQMTHISQNAWLNTYGTCKVCGASVSHYCCIASLFAVRPLAAEGFDWWVACDNDNCKNHVGEGVKQNNRPMW